MRQLAVLAFLVGARAASAEDRVSAAYVASRPVAVEAAGLAHAVSVRWDRDVADHLEVGGGVELGMSTGDPALVRFAILPGIAFVHPIGTTTLRVEEQIGWQIAKGRLTLDAIPLRGTEPRGFHNETAVALDAAITDTIALRARAGLAIDGIYPAGHGSTHVGPFISVGVVIVP